MVEPHNDWINDLYAELVDRYGERLDGLWLDENFQDCSQDKIVDYRRLMKTIKERNPDLVLTQNNGGFQAYGVDEGVQEVQWEYREGRMASQYQIFNQTAKSPEDMLITTVIQAAANTLGGGIQWSIDAKGPGKNTRGGLDAQCMPILDGFVKLFKPIAESVKNTHPSSSYPPPFSGVVVKFDNLTWGVATRSHDDTHGIPPCPQATGGQHVVAAAARGREMFANARLLDGGGPVALAQHDRGLTLTLPDGAGWRSPDTVIVMDVLSPGGVGLVNNTSLSVNYRGSSWKHRENHDRAEFRNDAHVATADGDTFSFTFNGTDVEWISGRGPDRGMVELAIDGVSQGTVDLSQGSGSFQSVFSKSGLARGTHTLTGTKRGGALMTVDAFKVSELVNDGETAGTFQETSRYGATAAALTGPWEPRGGTLINGQAFRFTFHGTGVEVFGGSAHGSGDLVITLNGQPHVTAHCHGGQTTRSLAKISGLPFKEHTVEGKFTNPHPAGFISALDGFAVTRPDFWAHRKNRGLGEIGDDAHISEIKGSTGSYAFNGSGVEIFTTRDAESRTAHYTLDGGGGSLWAGLNHYSPVTVAGSVVFRYPNLHPGSYTVGFSNAANNQGVNFSFVRLAIDALRVYKAESSSATPLAWGPDGMGGSGTWDAGNTANWHDGKIAVQWLDNGGIDYAAVFGGTAGTVTLGQGINANRLAFTATGYTLKDGTLTLTGAEPTLGVAGGAAVTLEGVIAGASGLNKAGAGVLTLTGTNTYTGGTRINAGTLAIAASGALGAGDLTVADGAVCQLGNPGGALDDSARVILTGKGKLNIAAGVVEKVAGLGVNGSAQPAGRYSAATHPDIITGDGVLVVGDGG